MMNAASAAAVQHATQEIGAAAGMPENVQTAALAWAQGYIAGQASAAKPEEPEQ